jgi:hypothetical protein
MDKIPLIYLKGGKLSASPKDKWIRQRESIIQELSDLSQKYGQVYIVDLDGYRKNRAHLDIYRSYSHKVSFWVDSAPRTPGDVMDLFISGAHRITLIWKIMDDNYLKEIREMCTEEIYLATKDEFDKTLDKAKKIGFDGIVVMNKPNIWQTVNKQVWFVNPEVNGKVMVQKYTF